MAEKQAKAPTTEDEQLAHIMASAEPGVDTALKVLEVTEQRYYAAVSQVASPGVVIRAVSHS